MKWLTKVLMNIWTFVLSCILVGAGFSITMFGSLIVSAILAIAGVIIILIIVFAVIQDIFKGS